MKLELKYHPAGDKPTRALILACFIAFMGGVILFVLNNMLVAALLPALTIYSLVPYFFPTYYTFDEQAITAKRLGKTSVYAWDDYRSFTVQANGIVLWTVVDLNAAESNYKEKMAVMRSSVFLLMTPQMIEKADGILRRKLALTKKKV